MKLKTFGDLKVGDGCNDQDCKFPAGTVRDIGSDWFTVEWERCGVTYNKDHPRAHLDEGALIAW